MRATRKLRYKAELAEAILKGVRDGLSPARAGNLAGVSRDTLGEWKKTRPQFAQAIARAESECIARRVKEIENCVNSKGVPDWHAQAWLLERGFRSEYGTKESEVNVNVSNTLQIALTEQQLAELQRRRVLALGGTPNEN